MKLLGSVDESDTTALAVYMTVASVITVVAVLPARETRNSSLRHDRITAEVDRVAQH